MHEIRNIERSLKTEERSIEGYALVFNSMSVDLGGFTEIIANGALTGVIERSDILCLLNHDIRRGVLARSRQGAGSLALSIDDTGLKYRFVAPQTTLGDELIESIERSDISGSSFVFSCKRDEWLRTDDGNVVRTILEIDELYDVSPVYRPAYDETVVKVDKRGMEAMMLAEQQRNAPPTSYFEGLRRKIQTKSGKWKVENGKLITY